MYLSRRGACAGLGGSVTCFAEARSVGVGAPLHSRGTAGLQRFGSRRAGGPARELVAGIEAIYGPKGARSDLPHEFNTDRFCRRTGDV